MAENQQNQDGNPSVAAEQKQDQPAEDGGGGAAPPASEPPEPPPASGDGTPPPAAQASESFRNHLIKITILLVVSWLALAYSTQSISVNSERIVHFGTVEATIKDLTARLKEMQASLDGTAKGGTANNDQASLIRAQISWIECELVIKHEEKWAVVGHMSYGKRGPDRIGNCQEERKDTHTFGKYAKHEQKCVPDCPSGEGSGTVKEKGESAPATVASPPSPGRSAGMSLGCMVSPSPECFEVSSSEHNNIFLAVSSGILGGCLAIFLRLFRDEKLRMPGYLMFLVPVGAVVGLVTLYALKGIKASFWDPVNLTIDSNAPYTIALFCLAGGLCSEKVVSLIEGGVSGVVEFVRQKLFGRTPEGDKDGAPAPVQPVAPPKT